MQKANKELLALVGEITINCRRPKKRVSYEAANKSRLARDIGVSANCYIIIIRDRPGLGIESQDRRSAA